MDACFVMIIKENKRSSNDLCLIVGPSGCGKSSLLKFFSNIEGVATVSLDYDIGKLIEAEHGLSLSEFIRANGSDEFCKLGISHLNKKSLAISCLCVVDVGAGFLNSELIYSALRTYRCVTIWASPEEAYKRFMTKKLTTTLQGMSFNKFAELEFSENKNTIYNSSDLLVDTTEMSLEDTFLVVKEFVLDN